MRRTASTTVSSRRDGPSLVLALNPQPFTYESLPFVGVAKLLATMPLPVPAIVDHAGDLGVLALQDLGDVTLQAHLGAVPAREHLGLYRLAVSFIEIMQRRGADLTSPSYPPYQVAFDEEKLLWELEFFTKHFLEGYRGVQIPPSDRARLRAEWESIARELAAEPRVLCHRDYHSRNLMVSGADLYIIDFQDARMGPDTYDLVSLLKDSYVDLGDDVIDESDGALRGAQARRVAEPVRARVGPGFSAPLRSDGVAAESESVGHIRLPDHRARESRLHSIHPAGPCGTRGCSWRAESATQPFEAC